MDFIDADKLSMTVILTAMNRFINETHGSKTAFLDGNQPDRLCAPMAEHIERVGDGKVITDAPMQEILVERTFDGLFTIRRRKRWKVCTKKSVGPDETG